MRLILQKVNINNNLDKRESAITEKSYEIFWLPYE